MGYGGNEDWKCEINDEVCLVFSIMVVYYVNIVYCNVLDVCDVINL